jgi:hypothetical protein
MEAADRARSEGVLRPLWLGPRSAYSLFAEMTKQPVDKQKYYLERMESEMNRYPYLFASEKDGDTYLWLEKLACYSPIIHLQQTNGTSSSHLPFTEEHNKNGIISGKPLLQAISKSYQQADESNMPPQCDEIYLTLEVFSGTSEMNIEIINKIQRSVEYWRTFIPEDGMKLSEAVKRME